MREREHPTNKPTTTTPAAGSLFSPFSPLLVYKNRVISLFFIFLSHPTHFTLFSLMRSLLILRTTASPCSSSSSLLKLSVFDPPPKSSSLLLRSPFLARFSTDRTLQPSKSTKMGVVAAAAAAAADEAGIAKRFWIKFKKESLFALYTPFVVSLASGKLHMDSFRHYISQDVHFLRAFARAYELAEECADDDDDKPAIGVLRKAVKEELRMHDSFLQEWGLDPLKESTPDSATVKYTDFLLATASGKIEGVKIATPFEKTKIAAYTLGAMTPCMRLYSFLGKAIQALVGPDESSHPYKKWIDNYSSASFEAAALRTENLLDRLSVSLTGEELEVIEKLYNRAMKLEIEFFAAQPIVVRTIVPLCGGLDPAEHRLAIFSDFDLTCTVVDSSAILAEIAIVTVPKSEAPKADQNEAESLLARKSSADLRNTWGVLSRQYTEEYEQCIESILPSEKEKEFNYASLRKALEQVSDFEKRANSRVIESGVLKGINLEDIKRAGERVVLQDGCTGFFQKIVKKEKLNADVHILSYCWCGDLIRSAFSAGDLKAVDIHANEFIYEESIATGGIVRKLESPMDKLEALKDVIEKNQSDEGKQLCVYIGDSVGDLLCLLEADVGIVVGSSLSLRKLGSQFGVSFVPLFCGLVKKERENECCNWKGLCGTLYTVSCWAEVYGFVFGPP